MIGGRGYKHYVFGEEERMTRQSPAPRGPASPMAKERQPESAGAGETKPKAPVNVQYEGTDIEELSAGTRGIVLLLLYAGRFEL